MPLSDPSLERVSACPVHFLWDGRGNGRALVRAGFLGFLVAAILAFVANIAHVDLVHSAALYVTSGAAIIYFAGQALTLLALRRA